MTSAGRPVADRLAVARALGAEIGIELYAEKLKYGHRNAMARAAEQLQKAVRHGPPEEVRAVLAGFIEKVFPE